MSKMEGLSVQNQGADSSRAGVEAGRVSVWKLAWQCTNWLALALAIGVVVAIPVISRSVLTRFRAYAEVVYAVGNSPSEENRVAEWAKNSPGVESFRCERRGGELWVRWEYRGSEQPEAVRNAPQHLRALGYTVSGYRGISSGGVPQPIAGQVADVLADPSALTASLMGTQLSFGLVGWWRIRSANRKGQPWPPLFTQHSSRSALIGLITGLGLFGVGCAYSAVLKVVFGASPASPWNAVETMRTPARVAILLFAVLGAPVGEEIFFRGYVFGAFKRANKVGYGIVISALLFAMAHFSDVYNIPAVFLFGVVLAWAFHRTGSLVTSVVAHAMNNGLAVAVMLFWRG